MLVKSNTLTGYQLDGLDGGLGNVKEFYFDDLHWTIRYLVADIGFWLSGRHVLISPHALGAVTEQGKHIAIRLTKKQMEDGPSLNSEEPVSRQFEEDYYGFYGWPPYWGGPFMWGSYPYIMGNTPLLMMGIQDDQKEAPEGKNQGDPHLRSTDHVRGYHVHTTDGDIGHIDDFIIDDESWEIRYLVVDTRNWWPGKRVLISPKWISKVVWEESEVNVSVSRESIKMAPPYSEDLLLEKSYEAALHKHYDHKGHPTGDQTPKAQLL